MRNLLSRFRRPAEAKASRAGAAIAVYVTGRPLWTPRDYAALAREGFQRNPVVHRAVRLVAEAAAALPLSLVEGGRMLDRHPLLALLRRPNPREGGARFLESVYGHLLVAGNAYLEAVAVEGSPRELYALRPDRADGDPAREAHRRSDRAVAFAGLWRRSRIGSGARPRLGAGPRRHRGALGRARVALAARLGGGVPERGREARGGGLRASPLQRPSPSRGGGGGGGESFRSTRPHPTLASLGPPSP